MIVETYQGARGRSMAPEGWFPKLEAWCRRAGHPADHRRGAGLFGRTGKLFGFQHYGITPNLLCLGRGSPPRCPLSAIVGEGRIMDSLTPGSLGSTHGGNALVRQVALENIDVILEERAERERRAGRGADAGPPAGDRAGAGVHRRSAGAGAGLRGGDSCAPRRRGSPDAELTRRIIEAAYRQGLLLIAPHRLLRQRAGGPPPCGPPSGGPRRGGPPRGGGGRRRPRPPAPSGGAVISPFFTFF